jgi:hypothetical protein
MHPASGATRIAAKAMRARVGARLLAAEKYRTAGLAEPSPQPEVLDKQAARQAPLTRVKYLDDEMNSAGFQERL